MRDFKTVKSGQQWAIEKGIILDNPCGGWKTLESFNNEPIHFTEFSNRAALCKPRSMNSLTRRDAAKLRESLKEIKGLDK